MTERIDCLEDFFRVEYEGGVSFTIDGDYYFERCSIDEWVAEVLKTLPPCKDCGVRMIFVGDDLAGEVSEGFWDRWPGLEEWSSWDDFIEQITFSCSAVVDRLRVDNDDEWEEMAKWADDSHPSGYSASFERLEGIPLLYGGKCLKERQGHNNENLV